MHQVLTNPVYASAYVYGKIRQERFVDQSGRLKKRIRRLPRSQWAVLLHNHHKGFIDWETYTMNQSRIASNTHPTPHQAGGAVREGAALLQGIATCGRWGRRLRVYYQGRCSTPGYYCAASNLANGRGCYCLSVGGVQIDEAVTRAFLDTVAPAGIEAALLAEESLQADHDAALKQWRLQVEQACYQAERAERRYRAVEPENRLVARTLEADWEHRLTDLAAAKDELAQSQSQCAGPLTDEQRQRIRSLGDDLFKILLGSSFSLLDAIEGLTVYSRCSLARFDKSVGVAQDVQPVYLVTPSLSQGYVVLGIQAVIWANPIPLPTQ